MGVQFDDSGTKYIKFTAPTNALGLVSKTITAKYFHTADPVGVGEVFVLFDGAGSDADEFNLIYVFGKKVVFLAHFSTTNGIWITTNDVLTVGAKHSIIVTYNGASTANNPIIYINGVSVALTESSTPAGTYRTGTGTDIYIGSIVNNATPNGIVEDNRIYNVIKTPAQVASIAAEDINTNAQIDESGLVFHAPLVMCKGLTYDTYVGSTLATANEFYDRINGYLGVPSGSPVGA